MTKSDIPFLPRSALISVSDKTGLVDLAHVLVDCGVELIATGNTAAMLRDEGFTVTEVSSRTGFPEMLDGRVKTLHPAIHGGLLARGAQDEKTLAAQNIQAIDLLIVNLYPFEQTIAHYDCDFDKAIANIDIGGPAMIRSAAKNHAYTTVIVTPDDYETLIGYLHQQRMPESWRFKLAKKAFAHTAAYDAAISNYLGTLNDEKKPDGFPEVFNCQFSKNYDLRYGENPHQQAVFYADKNAAVDSLANARLLQGKQLSYNNLLDADAALECVKSFVNETPACVIIKHGNPCGIALAETLTAAYQRAYQTDPSSAFGGILAFNHTVNGATAALILETQFAEVLVAPEFSQEALILLAKKPNIRVLETGEFNHQPSFNLNLRRISGGLLVQEFDYIEANLDALTCVTQQKPSEAELQDLLFAWTAAKHAKSNAIVFAKDSATLGIGAGQTSRIMSVRIAEWQAHAAGFSLQGAVMASDAFIPFPDSVEMAAQAGIRAIIQPGGSLRDEEVIAAANETGIAMIFTGLRHFKH